MELSFLQQIAVSAVQGFGLAVGAGAGWILFRRQERAKWDEQRAAELRRLQLEALLSMLRALGALHMRRIRRRGEEKACQGDAPPEVSARVLAALKAEGDAFASAIDTLTDNYFLLGPELGGVLRQAVYDLGRSKTSEEAEDIVSRTEQQLGHWVPPLERFTDRPDKQLAKTQADRPKRQRRAI